MFNTKHLNQETLDGTMFRMQLQYEDNIYAKLTNNRSITGSKVDSRREVVLKGYDKIMKLVERGIK